MIAVVKDQEHECLPAVLIKKIMSLIVLKTDINIPMFPVVKEQEHTSNPCCIRQEHAYDRCCNRT